MLRSRDAVSSVTASVGAHGVPRVVVVAVLAAFVAVAFTLMGTVGRASAVEADCDFVLGFGELQAMAPEHGRRLVWTTSSTIRATELRASRRQTACCCGTRRPIGRDSRTGTAPGPNGPTGPAGAVEHRAVRLGAGVDRPGGDRGGGRGRRWRMCRRLLRRTSRTDSRPPWRTTTAKRALRTAALCLPWSGLP